MTGPDHYRLAGELLTGRGVLDDLLIGTAQVRATLALAAATTMASDFGNRAEADAVAPSRWQHHDQLTPVTPICSPGVS